MHYFAVDSGTTNSRVWVIQEGEVLAKRQVPVGVRNTAIDGNHRALIDGIRQAILELKSESSLGILPRFAIAAGMITSNLGLHEVKHVQAPAGIGELAAGIQTRNFVEIEHTPFYFIPGIRSGPYPATLANVNSIDIMRGEETEIMGSLHQFELQGPLLYVHLGSLTKLIHVDSDGRISAGASTLAGELIHSVQQQTILRSSLPENPDYSFNEEFFDEGWSACAAHGLTRALYLVRILNLNSSFHKEDIASFFLGVILRQEFYCLESFLNPAEIAKVILSGLPHLHPAWNHALRQRHCSVRSLTAEETEKAFLTGLHRIFTNRAQSFD